VLEQLEARENLVRRRMNVSSSANSFADSWTSVEPRRPPVGPAKVTGLEHARTREVASAHQGAKPSQQLRERERLHQVVVGAGVQTGHTVFDRVACGKHENGRPHAVLP
jgi:hypothetical protein